MSAATGEQGDSPFDIPLRQLTPRDPLRWVAGGWRDFVRTPHIGLFFGGCFAGMGWALMIVYENAPAYLLALSGGFLLVGPVLCMGLYEASRLLERGERPTLLQAILAWRRKADTLAIFGLALLVLELVWSRAALVVFAVSFDAPPDIGGSLLRLLAPENLQFILTFIAVGAVFAVMIYAVSVVSIPMILDRKVDAIAAALTSLRLVLTQPGVMMLWAALLAAMLLASMLPWFAGLVVAGPVAGHASWHAYRAAVGDPAPPAAQSAT